MDLSHICLIWTVHGRSRAENNDYLPQMTGFREKSGLCDHSIRRCDHKFFPRRAVAGNVIANMNQHHEKGRTRGRGLFV